MTLPSPNVVKPFRFELAALDILQVGGVDLGATDGGAELKGKRTYHVFRCDQALSGVDVAVTQEDATLKLGGLSQFQLDIALVAWNLPAGNLTTVAGSAGRTFSDGVTTSGSPNLTSAAGASFVSGDVGRPVSGPGIPAGATILTYTSATAVVLSVNATASGTALSIVLGALPSTDTLTMGGQATATTGALVASGRRRNNTGERYTITMPKVFSSQEITSNFARDKPTMFGGVQFEALSDPTQPISAQLVTVTKQYTATD